jgi:TonB family protein
MRAHWSARKRGLPLALVTAVTFAKPCLCQDKGSVITVPAIEAELRLVKRGELSMPENARTTRICGSVLVAMVIDSNGRVASNKVVRGHPMLQRAAALAVSDNRYRPFEQNGVAMAAQTLVEVRFACDENQASEERAYFTHADKCRILLGAGKSADAESECEKAVKAADKVRGALEEQSRARRWLADALLVQSKAERAARLGEEALALGQKYLKPGDPELAMGYGRLGDAYAATSDLAKSDQAYDAAVSQWESAIPVWPSMKAQYTATLKATLDAYSGIKDKESQAEQARALRQKAQSLQPR